MTRTPESLCISVKRTHRRPPRDHRLRLYLRLLEFLEGERVETGTCIRGAKKRILGYLGGINTEGRHKISPRNDRSCGIPENYGCLELHERTKTTVF